MTKNTRKPKAANAQAEDLKFLDDLIKRQYEALIRNIDKNPKPGDFLKMIELRRKLSPDDTSQKELWKLLEKVRRDTLGEIDETGKKKQSPKKKRKPTGRKKQ